MAEKDVWFRLKEGGFPPDVMDKLKSGKGTLPKDIEKKLVKAKKLHADVGEGAVQLGRILLLLGPDSPFKDLFMGHMAMYFIEKGYKPKYTTPERLREDWSFPACYCLFVSEISYINMKDWVSRKAGEGIRNHIAKGRVAILSAETMEDVETAFGGPFVNYISSFGVQIDFPSTRPDLPKL